MTAIEVWPKFIHALLFVHGLLVIWYDGTPQYGVYNIGINTGCVHLTTTKTFYHINITPYGNVL